MQTVFTALIDTFYTESTGSDQIFRKFMENRMREQLSLSDIQYGPFSALFAKKDVTDSHYNGERIVDRDIHNIRHKGNG